MAEIFPESVVSSTFPCGRSCSANRSPPVFVSRHAASAYWRDSISCGVRSNSVATSSFAETITPSPSSTIIPIWLANINPSSGSRAMVVPGEECLSNQLTAVTTAPEPSVFRTYSSTGRECPVRRSLAAVGRIDYNRSDGRKKRSRWANSIPSVFGNTASVTTQAMSLQISVINTWISVMICVLYPSVASSCAVSVATTGLLSSTGTGRSTPIVTVFCSLTCANRFGLSLSMILLENNQ